MAASAAVFFLAAPGLLWPSDLAAQGSKLLARRAGGVPLDLAISRDQRSAKRRQRGATAVLPAGLPLDRGLPAHAVDLVDEVPCPLVGHVHRPSGGRNRPANLDILQ